MSIGKPAPKFTNEPSIFVDGDLDESIKRSASDRLGDLVPQVRARTSPGVFRDMALLGLCLELSFNIGKAKRLILNTPVPRLQGIAIDSGAFH